MTVTSVLGISAYYHDSAAALVRDGEIVAAAQEERFSRKKHDARFPRGAVNYCLEEGRTSPAELDVIVFYDHGVRTLDRALKNALMVAPKGKESFRDVSTSLLGSKVWIEPQVLAELGSLGRHGRLLTSEHHMAHAASAFYPSPFDEAAILTLDGVGEWATTTLGYGRAGNIELFREIDYPHSLGLLYSAFTYFCGFKVNSGEYKLMGLAPYGEPRYYDRIRERLIDVKEDGSFRLDTSYFGYLESGLMTNARFHELFGGEPRAPESRITRREMDIAASVQKVTEEVVAKLAREVRKMTGSSNLVMAGGVALNCVANGKVARQRIFDRLWIQPAAGDAGGALGAALLVSNVLFGRSSQRIPHQLDRQKGSYLGPGFSPDEVAAFLSSRGYPHRRVALREDRARMVASMLAEGKIVGFFSGRMEFGPRALGARSILGDPRRVEMQSVMNLKIKQRESFRPFAPAVLRERVSDYFDMDDDSPYMLLVAPVRAERRLTAGPARLGDDDDMLPVINSPRSDIPAVTHVDHSARIQTVHAETHPEFYAVLKAFEELTGCGVLVNTSFNVRGEPIVCSPMDAYRCFMRTGMDALVLEDAVLCMTEQPPFEDQEDWKSEYALD
jgi:carbamoyltransferase